MSSHSAPAAGKAGDPTVFIVCAALGFFLLVFIPTMIDSAKSAIGFQKPAPELVFEQQAWESDADLDIRARAYIEAHKPPSSIGRTWKGYWNDRLDHALGHGYYQKE